MNALHSLTIFITLWSLILHSSGQDYEYKNDDRGRESYNRRYEDEIPSENYDKYEDRNAYDRYEEGRPPEGYERYDNRKPSRDGYERAEESPRYDEDEDDTVPYIPKKPHGRQFTSGNADDSDEQVTTSAPVVQVLPNQPVINSPNYTQSYAQPAPAVTYAQPAPVYYNTKTPNAYAIPASNYNQQPSYGTVVRPYQTNTYYYYPQPTYQNYDPNDSNEYGGGGGFVSETGTPITANSPIIMALGQLRRCDLLFFTLITLKNVFPIFVTGGVTFICGNPYAQEPQLLTDAEKTAFVLQSIIPGRVVPNELCNRRAFDLTKNRVEANIYNGQCFVRGGLLHSRENLGNVGFAYFVAGLHVLRFFDLITGVHLALRLANPQVGLGLTATSLNLNSNNERCLITALQPYEKTLIHLGGGTCTLFLPINQDYCQLFGQGNIEHFIISEYLFPNDLLNVQTTTSLSRTRVDIRLSQGANVMVRFFLGLMRVNILSVVPGVPCIIYNAVEFSRSGRPGITAGGLAPVGRSLINLDIVGLRPLIHGHIHK